MLFVRVGFVATVLLIGTTSYCQESKPGLALLAGNWTGTLRYLDSRNIRTHVALQTRAAGIIELDTVKLELEYTEPSGKIIASRDWLWLSSDAKSLEWGGERDAYEVSKFNCSDTSLTLVAQKRGHVNNKNAIIRKTILVRGNTLTIAKQVRYTKTKKFFTRNTYSFIKE